MSIKLFRIDDRLIHGQVVVGWGQPLHVGFIVLVDDAVRASPVEQELYRMGVPPHIDVIFASLAEAVTQLPEWDADPRPSIVLAGDIATLAALTENCHRVTRINVGGIHARPGRSERSEEHTSELQSRLHLVCRLLLEKKKNYHMPRV